MDLLLIPGDVMDDDTLAFDRLGMAEAFAKTLQAPKFGTVVTLGNHDLYQRHAYQAITSAITNAGGVLLSDQAATIDIQRPQGSTTLSLIGRYDDHHTGRLETAALLADIDTSQPVILLDHRPSQIDTHSQLPIDLQVSGHTHNGQIFPANFIVAALNRIGYGHQLIDGTHFVVSSGFGFWGVPFRLGSRAEVWVIDMVGINSMHHANKQPQSN